MFVCHAILASVPVANVVSYVITYLFNDIHDQRATHASNYIDTFAIGFGIRLDKPVGPRKEPDLGRQSHSQASSRKHRLGHLTTI